MDGGQRSEKEGQADENGARDRPEADGKSSSLQLPPQAREKSRSNHNLVVEQLSRTSKHEKTNGSYEDGGLRAPNDSNCSPGRRAGDSLEKQDYDCYTSEGADAISRRP